MADVTAGGLISPEACEDGGTTPVEGMPLWIKGFVSPGVLDTGEIACADGRMADSCEPECTGATVALAPQLICEVAGTTEIPGMVGMSRVRCCWFSPDRFWGGTL